MTEFSDWLVRMYAKSLVLYPRNFRDEFAEEAQEIFNLGIKDATGCGFWGLVQFALRELRDLPLTLLALYSRERNISIMQKQLNRWFVHQPGSWAEMLLTSLPFLLMFGVLGLFSSDQMNEVTGLIGIVLLGLAIILLSSLGIIGLLVRLPRWAMPYAGVLITLAVFLVMMLAGLHSLFFSGQMSAPWWLRMVTFGAIYLFALAVTLILFLWLTSRFPLTNSFFAQAQKDWSILSLVMYGGAMTFVLGMYEEIVGAGLYILLTMVPLLVGIWAFLRISGAKGRIAALSVAILVAMGVALIANLQLMDWVSPLVFKIGSFGVTRSVLCIILTWLLCEAMLLLPMLLQHIPFIKQTQKQAV
jgi:hypothetical protein